MPVVISPTSPPPAPTPTAAFIVTTTLDGITTLPLRIQWEAKPIDPDHQVTGVDFLIDDQLAWVEYKAPYVYGGDGNHLVTSFLAPGEHRFAVRMFTLKGQSIDSALIKASVSAAPDPPDELTNTSWTHEVTKEDVKKATSAEPPPAGQWGLTINSVEGSYIIYMTKTRHVPQVTRYAHLGRCLLWQHQGGTDKMRSHQKNGP